MHVIYSYFSDEIFSSKVHRVLNIEFLAARDHLIHLTDLEL